MYANASPILVKQSQLEGPCPGTLLEVGITNDCWDFLRETVANHKSNQGMTLFIYVLAGLIISVLLFPIGLLCGIGYDFFKCFCA